MAADFRVLTPEVFEFTFANELKRAVRSQTYLTLLLLEVSLPDVAERASRERDRIVSHVAELVTRGVRETDIVAQSRSGQLSIVLLEADFASAARVVERVMARLVHYRFPSAVDISVSAASCPTHGADPESLRREAGSRPLLRTLCGARSDTSQG